ncbi:MAG TPA: ABC transporter permease, partial [Flavisolibacter sp.]|nr:ABC transporter permease [Flavisolibacter sp.]
MFRHSLLIAFRNIRRHKSSFLINLIGLSTGLACTFLIFLWVQDERGFDKFHVNDQRLYQVMERSEENGHVMIKEMTQGLLAESMAKDLPEVAAAVPVLSLQNDGTNVLLRNGDKTVKSSGIFAGPGFFSIFSFPLSNGNRNKVLGEKNNIVLTGPLAVNLFGSAEQAIGKRVDFEFMGEQKQLVVSGITNPPANNSQKFDFALTYDLLMKDLAPNMKEWYNEGPSTYLLLKPGADADRLSIKIRDFIKNYRKETIFTLFLRPYSSAYLYGRYEEGKQAGGRIEYVRLFSIVALFILIIACINFMNLSTAKASRRMKEVGIKKAIGSTRKALIIQFLCEAVFMSLLALVAAIFLMLLLLPVFNEVTGKQLEWKAEPGWIAAAVGISVLTGLLSGSYPALYLSGFNPIAVLKGKVKNSVGELLARKGLVVFQFMISLVLIIAVMVVYKQIDYVQSKNLGYDRSNVLYFDKEGAVVKNAASFLAELKKIPGVVNASAIQQSVVQVNQGAATYGIEWPGKSQTDLVNFNIRMVDFDLLETLGFGMREGRSFSRSFGGEDDKLIFNETAIRVMGL